MSKNMVKTINGEELPIEQCKKFDEGYYKIGDSKIRDSGDCYKIGDRYYRNDTGYIVYDCLKGEYVINSGNIVKGVVGIDKDGDLLFDTFSKNPVYNATVVVGGKRHTVIDSSIFKNNRRYRYHITDNKFYKHDYTDSRHFNRIFDVDDMSRRGLDYNCDNSLSSYIGNFENTELRISDRAKQLSKSLGDLSFGFEFETIRGMVPKKVSKHLGLIPLRDGSISGLEYATIPYTGAKGIEAVKLACETLDLHTDYDDGCSLHLHIGGMPRTKEFLLALFKLLCNIQDEMFGMFPIYKKYNFGVKRKNYTKPLPILETYSKMDNIIDYENIDRNFDILFKFLSGGISIGSFNNDLDEVQNHPSDPRGRSKWNILSRYHWVNLIPIVFGNKKTVEFRIHTPTTDYNKVLSYLFICGSIINYAKKNWVSILRGEIPNNISDMVYSVYGKDGHLIRTVLTYMSRRRDVTYSQNMRGNIKGDESEIESIEILSSDTSSRYGGSRRFRELMDSLSGIG